MVSAPGLDPDVFLSTLVTASAALVAIVGGLLVARFVGMDSEQQGIAKAIGDAGARRDAARARREAAEQAVLDRDAFGFLGAAKVRSALIDGETNLSELRALAPEPCPAADADLTPYLRSALEELGAARRAVEGFDVPLAADTAAADASWVEDRRDLAGFSNARWPSLWKQLYTSRALDLGEERKRQQSEERDQQKAIRRRFGMYEPPTYASVQSFRMPTYSVPVLGTSRATVERRYDDLVSARERARQQVDDLEAELGRLELDRGRLRRPDARLWIGIAIVAYLAVFGVGLPAREMIQPQGPSPHLAWLFWLFTLGLSGLIVYILGYLVLLTRKASSVGGDTSGENPNPAPAGGNRRSS